MLWITEYGIWPSTEDPYTFRRMRVSYGLSDDLNNLPGHQFSSEETDDLRLFLTLVLIFGWGGYLVTECPDSRKFSLFISHDGWLSARSNNELHPLLTRLLA